MSEVELLEARLPTMNRHDFYRLKLNELAVIPDHSLDLRMTTLSMATIRSFTLTELRTIFAAINGVRPSISTRLTGNETINDLWQNHRPEMIRILHALGLR